MRHKNKKIVVIGVGNILLGDEGVGIHAVTRLKRDFHFPSTVEIVDGGVGGINLLPFLEETDNLIIIDAVQADAEPGAIFKLFPEDMPCAVKGKASLHEMGLQEVFLIAKALGRKLPNTVIIGIQPKDASSHSLELTPEVEKKLPQILKTVLEECQKIGITVKRK